MKFVVQFLFVLIILPALMLCAFSCRTAAAVVPADDAYHYRYFEDGRHDWCYIEWWYFNLYDPVQDVQAIFSYAVRDPENLTGSAMSNVGVIVYSPEGVVAETDTFSTEMFNASYIQADVTIGDNNIEVLDSDTYRIDGSIAGGRISWDLVFTMVAESWFGKDREWVGLFPWEEMSWLIYMPGAHVDGTIKIDGRTYEFNGATGYHDHNWGEWIPWNAMWDWFQYFEPGFNIEIGDFRNHESGVLSIDFDGDRTVFAKEDYRIINTRWNFDWLNGKFFPVKTHVIADNDTLHLDARVTVFKTEPLRMIVPIPFMPDVIIYEQTAWYEGELWGKDEHGDPVLLHTFASEGFKEYTIRKWIK